MLLNFIGEEGITIFNTFSFNGDDEQENYDLVVGKFKEYCEPQKNIYMKDSNFTNVLKNQINYLIVS